MKLTVLVAYGTKTTRFPSDDDASQVASTLERGDRLGADDQPPGDKFVYELRKLTDDVPRRNRALPATHHAKVGGAKCRRWQRHGGSCDRADLNPSERLASICARREPRHHGVSRRLSPKVIDDDVHLEARRADLFVSRADS